MKRNKYYPSLFKTKKKQVEQEVPDIPLNTLKFEKIRPTSHDQITIFGTTDHKMLIEKLEEIGKIASIEYGSNYLKVIFENEESYRKCLKMNHKNINGEIIGVFRNKIEIKESIQNDVGLLRKIINYLF